MAHLFRDDMVEVGDDVFVYYPDSTFGPGYVLGGEGRDKFLSNYGLMGWALFAAFVFPDDFAAAKLFPFQSDSLMAQLSGGMLAVALFLVLLWIIDRRIERFLNCLDKRSPDFRDEDIEQLKRQVAARERNARIFIPIFGLFFAACLINLFLEYFFFFLSP